jgi:hypothetical protein
MKVINTIQKINSSSYRKQIELPGVFICFIFLAITPVSGAISFFSGALWQANLVALGSLLNGLICDRSVYQATMTTGYLIQNRSKIISAIPMAFQIICQAVERVCRVLFGLPSVIFYQLKESVEMTDNTLQMSGLSYSKNSGIETEGWVKKNLLKDHLTDDFFWHNLTKDAGVER